MHITHKISNQTSKQTKLIDIASSQHTCQHVIRIKLEATNLHQCIHSLFFCSTPAEVTSKIFIKSVAVLLVSHYGSQVNLHFTHMKNATLTLHSDTVQCISIPIEQRHFES